MLKKTHYKVFIASPAGLEDERRAFKKQIEEYNEIEAKHSDVIFDAVGWEDTLPGVGRPQSKINKELEECDYFILLLHDRWGSYPGKNKENSSSGTEEEYQIAWECYQNSNKPMKQIVCLFKSVPHNQLADPGPQLKKVVAFRRKIEDEKKLFYSNFSSIDEFLKLLWRNLAQWLRDDNAQDGGGYIYPEDSPHLQEDINLKSNMDSIGTKDPNLAEMIDKAHSLAKEGKLTDAEIEFTKALVINPSEYQLLNFAEFLIDTGQLARAIVMIDRAAHLAESGQNLAMKAVAYSYKGNVLQTRGNLAGAEAMYKKSLEIDERLERLEGMAANYGNLGIIQRTKGDLDAAEAMYKKSLELNEQLGRLEGMAANYGNLGIVLRIRGDLDGAKAMHKKSLEIEEKLGRLKGMANQYGNLGIVLRVRGDLDDAEKMLKKSLELNEQLGRLEGMANQYGNLGVVLEIKGDLDGAEAMYKKSLKIDEKLGRLEGMAVGYGNLGIVLQTKGDLDDAEAMYKKSLELNEQLERLQGMANQYVNLGNVLKIRGHLDGAEAMYKKSLEIAQKAGFKPIIEVINKNLELLKKNK